MSKDELFTLIQEYLKNTPVVIWGSGATVAFGMPSMTELNNILKSNFDFFDKDNQNLEEELGKEKYNEKLPEIRNLIWDVIERKDIYLQNDILSNSSRYDGIIELANVFLEAHPHNFSIITTNYDRVLENVLSKKDIPFTDGFSGRLFSLFDNNLIREKKENRIQLLKVHGSLNWFNVEGDIRYYYKQSSYAPVIIPPGKNKYQQAFTEPYRSLIQISDELIQNSKSLLIIGFGFNDEHLTPKIKDKLRKGEPIVILTKEITTTTKELLQDSTNYLTIEQSKKDENTTRVIYKRKNEKMKIVEEIEGDYWQLNNFMEALYVKK